MGPARCGYPAKVGSRPRRGSRRETVIGLLQAKYQSTDRHQNLPNVFPRRSTATVDFVLEGRIAGDTVNRILEALRREAVAADDIASELQLFEPEAEMRYVGQELAVALPLPDHNLTQQDLPDLMKRFNELRQ